MEYLADQVRVLDSVYDKLEAKNDKTHKPNQRKNESMSLISVFIVRTERELG